MCAREKCTRCTPVRETQSYKADTAPEEPRARVGGSFSPAAMFGGISRLRARVSWVSSLRELRQSQYFDAGRLARSFFFFSFFHSSLSTASHCLIFLFFRSAFIPLNMTAIKCMLHVSARCVREVFVSHERKLRFCPNILRVSFSEFTSECIKVGFFLMMITHACHEFLV